MANATDSASAKGLSFLVAIESFESRAHCNEPRKVQPVPN
jgi:hypothetical protein